MYKPIKIMLVCALAATCLCGCKDKKAEETVPTEETTIPTEAIETEPIVTEPPAPEYITNQYGTFRVVDEAVTTEANAYLRTSPNGSKICVIDRGITIKRVGIGDENGWSIVMYNDEEAYIASYYVYPVERPVYTEVEDVIIAQEEAHVRNGPSIKAQSLGKVKQYGELIRIAEGSDGWSKVKFKDSEAYVFTLYFKVKEHKPVEVENPDSAESQPESVNNITVAQTYTTDTGAVYTIVNETVTAARTVNVRKGPGTNYEKVGSLAGAKSIVRVAIGDDGWSKVIYEGEEAYILTRYLLK